MSDIPFYEQQLSKARRDGNRQLMGTYLGSLGNLYASQGNISKGIQCLEESRQIKQSLGDWDGVALVCKNLAGCYELGLNDLATAAKYMEIAAKVASPNNPMKESYQAMALGMRERLGETTRERAVSTQPDTVTKLYLQGMWEKRFDELYTIAERMMPLLEAFSSAPVAEDSVEGRRIARAIDQAEALLSEPSSETHTSEELKNLEWLVNELRWIQELLEAKRSQR